MCVLTQHPVCTPRFSFRRHFLCSNSYYCCHTQASVGLAILFIFIPPPRISWVTDTQTDRQLAGGFGEALCDGLQLYAPRVGQLAHKVRRKHCSTLPVHHYITNMQSVFCCCW